MNKRSPYTWIILSVTMLVCGVRSPVFGAEAGEAEGAPTAIRPTEALCDLSRAFLPKPLARAGYFSSYDRTGGNADGFKGTYSALYRLANGEHVIVDLPGPGCLYTLWFTGPSGGYELPWGLLRFYLDDEEHARLAITGKELFTGDSAAFPRPLVANSYTSTGGNVCFVPIPFQKRLVITTEKQAGFYNAYYHLYPPGTEVTSWTGKEDLSTAIAAWNAVGAEPEAARRAKWYRGVAAVPGRRGDPQEILNVKSAGVVTVLRLIPTRQLSAAALNNLWLRIWWDDEKSPSVNVPVGPFFGSAQGEASVRALPIGMSPSGPYYCHLPMPFRKAARIVLENKQYDSPGDIYYEIAVQEPGDRASSIQSGRFKAVYRQEQPTTLGQDYTILEAKGGQGVYVGHCLIVQPYSAGNKRWWEGDLRIRVDQGRHPILQGTGHEDELLGGWSSRWLQGPYSLPLHGLPSVVLFPERTGSQWNGAITAYRFFAGGIPFRNGIRVTTEHGTNNDVVTNYASVAYYYYQDQPGMTLTDSLDVGNGESEREHAYKSTAGETTGQVSAHFDGDNGITGSRPHAETGRAGQSFESFVLKIDPHNKGVLVRRLYLQSYGRHRARISIDGKPADIISVPDDNRVDRWREQDLILPPARTAGADRIAVTIETEPGGWNAFSYEAWSLQ